ncbi:MAG: hypothetical protein MI865_01650, partial [Proteobacteria bacterium]|nr:hypothetical protein [Pseudomonadota bacterium]
LEYVLVANNRISCSGEDCGISGSPREHAGAAIDNDGGGNLTIDHSAIIYNSAECFDEGCNIGGIISMQRVRNFPDPDLFGDFQMTYSLVKDNKVICEGNNCDDDELIKMDATNILITDSHIVHNLVSCHGENCDSDEMLEPSQGNFRNPGGDFTMRNVKVDWNRLECTGRDCDTDEMLDSLGSLTNFLMENTSFNYNTLTCEGFDCDVDEIVDESEALKTHVYKNVQFIGNLFRCDGESCDTDDLFCVRAPEGNNSVTPPIVPEPLEITNVKFIGNVNICTGKNCDGDALIEIDADGAGANIRNLLVLKNSQFCDGNFCEVEEFMRVTNDGPAVMERVALLLNKITCEGEDCHVGNSCHPGEGGPSGLTSCTEGSGGALRISGNPTFRPNQDIMLRDSIIAWNTTFGSGAGIVNDGILTVERTKIFGNRAGENGGGILNGRIIPDPGDLPEDGTLIVRDSKIKRNRAGNDGGGINNLEESDLTLEDTKVKRN